MLKENWRKAAIILKERLQKKKYHWTRYKSHSGNDERRGKVYHTPLWTLFACSNLSEKLHYNYHLQCSRRIENESGVDTLALKIRTINHFFALLNKIEFNLFKIAAVSENKRRKYKIKTKVSELRSASITRNAFQSVIFLLLILASL